MTGSRKEERGKGKEERGKKKEERGKRKEEAVACVASVSARVRRESWEESKKRSDGGGGGQRRKRLPAIGVRAIFCQGGGGR